MSRELFTAIPGMYDCMGLRSLVLTKGNNVHLKRAQFKRLDDLYSL